MKRIIIGFVICLVLILAAAAVLYICNINTPRMLSDNKAAEFNVYELTLPDSAQGDTFVDRALSLCRFTEEITSENYTYSLYTSDELQNCLYDCERINDISTSYEGKLLRIFYTTSDGLDVTLEYYIDVMTARVLYNKKADELISQGFGSTMLYPNINKGTEKMFSDREEAEAEAEAVSGKLSDGYDKSGQWWWMVTYPSPHKINIR